MRLFWSLQARDDLLGMIDYLSDKNPDAARALYKRIQEMAINLLESPQLGRPGRLPGTRELVILQSPYILPYQIRDNRIEILRVYHAARKWPDQFK